MMWNVDQEKAATNMVVNEMLTANKEHGYFHSDHEGVAVIEEEVEETLEEWNGVQNSFYGLRNAVFADTGDSVEFSRELYTNALHLMLEAMQVAAMAMKFERSHKMRENVRNNNGGFDTQDSAKKQDA